MCAQKFGNVGDGVSVREAKACLTLREKVDVIHVFCCVTDADQEGYGMPVKCRNCVPVDLFLLMTASVLLV